MSPESKHDEGVRFGFYLSCLFIAIVQQRGKGCFVLAKTLFMLE